MDVFFNSVRLITEFKKYFLVLLLSFPQLWTKAITNEQQYSAISLIFSSLGTWPVSLAPFKRDCTKFVCNYTGFNLALIASELKLLANCPVRHLKALANWLLNSGNLLLVKYLLLRMSGFLLFLFSFFIKMWKHNLKERINKFVCLLLHWS